MARSRYYEEARWHRHHGHVHSPPGATAQRGGGGGGGGTGTSGGGSLYSIKAVSARAAIGLAPHVPVAPAQKSPAWTERSWAQLARDGPPPPLPVEVEALSSAAKQAILAEVTDRLPPLPSPRPQRRGVRAGGKVRVRHPRPELSRASFSKMAMY